MTFPADYTQYDQITIDATKVGTGGTSNQDVWLPAKLVGDYSWTTQFTGTPSTWTGVAYGNGMYVAVGAGNSSYLMSSPDGIIWTVRTAAVNNNWFDVAYGNGLFVAVAINGAGDGVMTSPDGITWTSRSVAADNQWRGVTYGNGLFVAVANSGFGNRVITSPDGITWTNRTSAADAEWYGVVYDNGVFVAVARNGIANGVMTSIDGITWTIRSSAVNNNWHDVTYGNGLFVAVAGTGTGDRVMTSPDGITWTSRSSAANNEWHSVTYGNGLFVAVSRTGTGDRVMTSADGITWTIRSSAADNNWSAITYGNGLFVAVANSGINNQVMISDWFQILTHTALATLRGDGGDARFTMDVGTTQLARDAILDTSGLIVGYRVKIPTLSDTTDTVIRCWYNGIDTEPTAVSTYGRYNAYDANTAGYWPMEEDPAGIAPQLIDRTANANDGTTGGAMTIADLVFGKVGNGLGFDGTNDYVDLGNSASLFPAATMSFTISMWFKSSDTNDDYLISKRTSSQPKIMQIYWAYGTIRCVMQDAANQQSRDQTALAYNDGVWHKIDYVYDHTTGTSTIYIDGAVSTNAGFKQTVVLGDWSNNGANLALNSAFDAPIGAASAVSIYDDLVISPSVRPVAWITTRYNNESIPATFFKNSTALGLPPASPGNCSFPVIGSSIIRGSY